MINLLPPDMQRNIKAGRSNTLLLRYNILLLITVACIAAAVSVVFVYLGTAKAQAEATITSNQQDVKQYAATAQQAQEFRTNLLTAKTILDKKIDYSRILIAIGSVTPKDTVLTSLTLDPKTFGTATDIKAAAKSTAAAIALKQAFEHYYLFQDVYFQNVSNNSDAESAQAYPYTISFSATIKKGVVLP